MKTNCTIRWIEIYPVDNAIHLSNNWGQLDSAIQSLNNQAPVVQTLDSTIHRINHYPADSVIIIDFRNTYLLDSDLSAG